MSVSDAFGSVEIPASSPPEKVHGAKPGSERDELSAGDVEQVTSGVLNLADANKKLISSQNAALEVGRFFLFHSTMSF